MLFDSEEKGNSIGLSGTVERLETVWQETKTGWHVHPVTWASVALTQYWYQRLGKYDKEHVNRRIDSLQHINTHIALHESHSIYSTWRNGFSRFLRWLFPAQPSLCSWDQFNNRKQLCGYWGFLTRNRNRNKRHKHVAVWSDGATTVCLW